MPATSPNQGFTGQPGLSDSPPEPSLLATPERGGGHFPNTHWSVVLAAAGGQTPAALETLCRAYWKPLFVAARRLGHPEHDAQDLTQAFFEQFLEKGYIRAADPNRGRFRTFLFTSFKHFIRGEWVKTRAAKRGGGKSFVPWHSLSPAEEVHWEPPENLSVEAIFDHQWALSVFDAAMTQLREESVTAGKSEQFNHLKQFLSQLGTQADYARVAERCGITPGAVAVAVRRLRVRYGELLRAQVANTLANAEDIEDEIGVLKKSLIG